MNSKSKKLTQAQIDELVKQHKSYEIESKQPYVSHVFQLEDLRITVYTSGTVLFQGKDLSFMEDKTSFTEHAGSDEVGTGDYFGPVVVCACNVSVEDYESLKTLSIMDSKKLTDRQIAEMGPVLVKKLKHSLLILDNTKYNSVQTFNNMNAIKAKLHNQAYLHLSRKTELPEVCIIDQFTPEKTYYGYLHYEKDIFRKLHFETKAESHYFAVACASIIARYAFIQAFMKLEEHYDFSFPKGAGPLVDQSALEFALEYGWDELPKVAKMNFKNTERVREAFNQSQR